jgi:hypothetical protein
VTWMTRRRKWCWSSRSQAPYARSRATQPQTHHSHHRVHAAAAVVGVAVELGTVAVAVAVRGIQEVASLDHVPICLHVLVAVGVVFAWVVVAAVAVTLHPPPQHRRPSSQNRLVWAVSVSAAVVVERVVWWGGRRRRPRRRGRVTGRTVVTVRTAVSFVRPLYEVWPEAGDYCVVPNQNSNRSPMSARRQRHQAGHLVSQRDWLRRVHCRVRDPARSHRVRSHPSHRSRHPRSDHSHHTRTPYRSASQDRD